MSVALFREEITPDLICAEVTYKRYGKLTWNKDMVNTSKRRVLQSTG